MMMVMMMVMMLKMMLRLTTQTWRLTLPCFSPCTGSALHANQGNQHLIRFLWWPSSNCKSLQWSLFYEQTCNRFTQLFVRSSPCPKYLFNHSRRLFRKHYAPTFSWPKTTHSSHHWPPRPTKPDQGVFWIFFMYKGLNAHHSANGPSVTKILSETSRVLNQTFAQFTLFPPISALHADLGNHPHLYFHMFMLDFTKFLHQHILFRYFEQHNWVLHQASKLRSSESMHHIQMRTRLHKI